MSWKKYSVVEWINKYQAAIPWVCFHKAVQLTFVYHGSGDIEWKRVYQSTTMEEMQDLNLFIGIYNMLLLTISNENYKSYQKD